MSTPSPSASSPTRVRRPWIACTLAALGLGLLVAYPPFRIVSQRDAGGSGGPAGSPAAFAPAAFAEAFWTAQLLPAAERAPDLGPILEALRRDPVAAAQTHARRVALGNAACYFARGTGRIIAVEPSRVLVELGGVIVAVRTGPVFGNAVRDGCGLLDVNQVPGLAEFNALAAELNRIVEQRVQPGLKVATVGATLAFAGAAEAPEALPASGPVLTFIPVRADVKP
jgi:predicted lipoprotein